MGVRLLLARQVDRQADRGPAGHLRSFIGRRHQPRPAAGDHREARIDQSARRLSSQVPPARNRPLPSRAEDRDGSAHTGERTKRVQGLLGDPPDAGSIVPRRQRVHVSVDELCELLPGWRVLFQRHAVIPLHPMSFASSTPRLAAAA